MELRGIRASKLDIYGNHGKMEMIRSQGPVYCLIYNSSWRSYDLVRRIPRSLKTRQWLPRWDGLLKLSTRLGRKGFGVLGVIWIGDRDDLVTVSEVLGPA